MVNSIGDFIKSVFPSTVNRNGAIFKALLADGTGGGTIERIFEELEQTRAAWTGAKSVYDLPDDQLTKMFGLISPLIQADGQSDNIYVNRNEILFYFRNGRATWGSRYDILAMFRDFFGIEEVFLVNNCAPMRESLLADGDFEDQNAWTLNACSYERTEAFAGKTSVFFSSGGTLKQSASLEEAGTYFLHFFLLGSVKVKITNQSGERWSADAGEFGGWTDEDVFLSFAAEKWDNRSCHLILKEAGMITVEFQSEHEGTLVDYVRLHKKTGTSMFAIIAEFSGGTSSMETASLAPGREDYEPNEKINYEYVSYFDNAFIFGTSGMRAQEVSDKFLEVIQPAGVIGCVEILIKETDLESADEVESETDE